MQGFGYHEGGYDIGFGFGKSTWLWSGILLVEFVDLWEPGGILGS